MATVNIGSPHSHTYYDPNAVISSTLSSHTHTLGSHTHTLTTRRTYPLSVLDKKINSLVAMANNTVTPENQSVFHIFRYNTVDNAISVFGNYNPLYAGKPKWLAMKLLEGAAGRARINGRLLVSGLVYKTPMLIGVRKSGMHTSYVGLALLDHWAEKFPRFKAFVDAYVSKKMRRKIASDCFDLSLNIAPKEWADAETLNKVYLTKWEARQYRKMKKTQALNEAQAIKHQQLLLQQGMSAAQQQYRQSLNNTAIGSQIMGPMYGK